MRKIAITYFLLLIFHPLCHAQYFPIPNAIVDKDKGVFELGGDVEMGSNAIPQSFYSAYANGNFLSDNIKSKAINALGSNNNLGIYADVYLRFQSRLRKVLGIKNSKIGLGFSTNALIDSKFNSDIFKLYFVGNSIFENSKAQLTPMYFHLIHFSMLSLSYTKQLGKLELGFKVGLALGHKTSEIEIYKGSLFTAKDGEFVDLDLNLKSIDNNLNKSRITNLNGFGPVLGASLGYALGEHSYFQINCNGIGSIHWNSNSSQNIVDTFTHFQGVEIKNLFDSIYLDLKSQDELKQEFIHKTKGITLNTPLPFQVSIQFQQNIFNDRMQFNLNYNYIHTKTYKSKWTLGSLYMINSNFGLGFIIGTGGFTKLNAGLSFQYRLFSNFIISAHYSSLLNNTIKAESLNQIAGFRVSKYF